MGFKLWWCKTFGHDLLSPWNSVGCIGCMRCGNWIHPVDGMQTKEQMDARTQVYAETWTKSIMALADANAEMMRMEVDEDLRIAGML